MWLIRVEDEVLVYFVNEKRPKYAILSHRWDEKHPEVTFQDMGNRDKAVSMYNYQKIRRTCEQAATYGLEYVWIDTCCINKDSSAELTEAIDSMFLWYKDAALCYAYLVDVACEPEDERLHSSISSSEWFERGWTLQELIAPRKIHFLNKEWTEIGTKSSLTTVLHKKTGIDMAILSGDEPITSQSIAQRMSWASSRVTTRTEDTAYCLLGLFDVNMPLLYGEGDKAFLRLQEEIIKNSDDHSLLAWRIEDEKQSYQPVPDASIPATAFRPLHGLLAHNPAAFQACGNVTMAHVSQHRSAYTITNRGISIVLCAT